MYWKNSNCCPPIAGIQSGHGAEGEVEHVDHAALEEWGVAAVGREHGGDFGRHGVVEDASVEHAVEDVAGGSGGDERQGHYEAGAQPAGIAERPQDPYQHGHGHDAQHRQADLAPQFEPEGHAVVFDELEVEPGRDFVVLAHEERGLDPYLEGLVGHQHRQDYEQSPQSPVRDYLVGFSFCQSGRWL